MRLVLMSRQVNRIGSAGLKQFEDPEMESEYLHVQVEQPPGWTGQALLIQEDQSVLAVSSLYQVLTRGSPLTLTQYPDT